MPLQPSTGGARVWRSSSRETLASRGRWPRLRLRRNQLPRLRQLPPGAGPSVVAGDLNETSSGPAWQSLAAGRIDPNAEADLPTFSTSNPRRRIDTILVPDSWATAAISPLEIVPESEVIAATDHRPVIVDVLG